MKELTAIYPDMKDFIASTAVARLNGYAGGFGTKEDAKEQLNSLGLSEYSCFGLLEGIFCS